MLDTDPYVMLIASLPSPDALFLARQPPLSRLRLEQRLRVLTPDDAATLALIEHALRWRDLPRAVTDEEAVARGRRAMAQLGSETLRLVVRDVLELRTCIAGLRRRHRGEPAPPPDAAWGFGRWLGQMARDWSEPAFRLDGVFPWLREADALLRQGDATALERLVLEQAYRGLERRSGPHTFDFEAVVIYVLKWDIVDTWGRYNGEAAARRFEDLCQAALGDYAQLGFEGDG